MSNKNSKQAKYVLEHRHSKSYKIIFVHLKQYRFGYVGFALPAKAL